LLVSAPRGYGSIYNDCGSAKMPRASVNNSKPSHHRNPDVDFGEARNELTRIAAYSRSVDPLANMEASLLTWCRAGMYVNPFMAFGNAMLAGYVMSRLRRHRRG
jgi:hypothetical protein